MKRFVSLMMVLSFALVACGSSGEEGGGETDKACPKTPKTMAGMPKLPKKFPSPSGVSYTKERKAGPSSIVSGFFEGSLDDAYNRYKDALGQAPYKVTDSEEEADDAEVNFSGSNTTGQVKLKVECKDRVSVDITVRPG